MTQVEINAGTPPVPTSLDVFLKRLDGLVVFLAAAHEEVFELIHDKELTWFPMSQNPVAPETAKAYRHSISNAAFLLGYAYLETFLADIARQVYLRRPKMLPEEKQLAYKDIVAAESSGEILLLIVEKEIRSVFGGPIEDVQKHFERKLNIRWPNEPEIFTASRMRNCLMHNGGVVDPRLAGAAPTYPLGTLIELEPDNVHGYGLVARRFANGLWENAVRTHLRGDDSLTR
ncbi:MAG: hypothetical protein JNM66_29505 [Bryobacterales bacterium]|nr:hypothetical protein [Bryobacterales bacterium]